MRRKSSTENDRQLEERIVVLEKQVDTLKSALGVFAQGLDKVSKVQAEQTHVVSKLVEVSEDQTRALIQLSDTTKDLTKATKENNSLLKRLLSNGGK